MLKFSPKQRMATAIQHQPVDHLPTQINYTQTMGEVLASHLGVSFQDLPCRLGNHLLRLDISHQLTPSPDGKTKFDWWGVGWSTETEGYWPTVCPLAAIDDLDSFSWPDPYAPDLLEDAVRMIAEDGGQHFLAPNLGFALYERAWSLRGFEKLNMELALNPGFVGELLDRITHIQIALARRFITLGVDGGYFGDDYGAQNGMLFSPRTWRALFKPYLARLFAVFQQANLPVILHSDGNIAPILPDLVEIGLTVLNPVQPEVLDLKWLKKTFGNELAYYGGVSTQTTLPFGTPAEVRAAAIQAIQALASDGTGLILAPSHRMTADIPIKNVDELLEIFNELSEA
jgi:uroporphyrinogen decarboxylase